MVGDCCAGVVGVDNYGCGLCPILFLWSPQQVEHCFRIFGRWACRAGVQLPDLFTGSHECFEAGGGFAVCLKCLNIWIWIQGSYLVSDDTDTLELLTWFIWCLEGFWVPYFLTKQKKASLLFPPPKKICAKKKSIMAVRFHGHPSVGSRNHLRQNYQMDRRSSDPGSPTERHAHNERRGSAASEMPVGARPSMEGHSRWGLDMGWIWLDIWLAFYLEQRSEKFRMLKMSREFLNSFSSLRFWILCPPSFRNLQLCRSGSKHVPSRASSRQGSRQQSKESVEDVTVLPSGVWSATIQERTGKKQKNRIEERFWRDFAGDGGDVFPIFWSREIRI